MYTEEQLQEGIKTSILSLSAFKKGDVVINDWTIFDQQISKSPYVIIGNCSNPEISYRAEEHIWPIPMVIAIGFGKTWQVTENEMRDRRQDIITLFETDPYQQLGLSAANEGLEVENISPITEFLPWYDPALSEADRRGAYPLFIFQELALTVRNY